jgi:hypothetical protein
MWQKVVIAGSVGLGGQNNSADVVKIIEALRAVQARPPLSDESNLDALGEAIRDLQFAFGLTVDGRIDPGGKTLRRLNDLGMGLKLVGIRLASLRANRGGYRVDFEGELPVQSYTLHLLVPPTSSVRLPEGAIPLSRKGELDRNGLVRLLAAIDTLRAWATASEGCLVVARDDGAVVTQSNVQSFDCPIRPYSGRLVSNLAELDPPMDYTIETEAAFFTIPPIGGSYYFIYGGLLVTDPAMRGFDCTTYAGSVLGVDARANDLPMGGTGETLANHLEAEAVGLESASDQAIRSFFATHTQGVFIAWNVGHVILVVNGVAHEFTTAPRRGYMRRPIAPAQSVSDIDVNRVRTFQGAWSVRRVPEHRVPAGWT